MRLAARLENRPRLRIFVWAFFLALICGAIELGEPVDDTIRSVRDRIRAQPASGQIVVVGVDDRTAARFGGFTFERDVDARLLDGLFARGARRVFIDRIYADPMSPAKDQLFAATLAKYRGRVFLGGANPQINGSVLNETVPQLIFRRAAEFRSLNGQPTPFRISARLTLGDKYFGQFVPSASAALAGLNDRRDILYRPDWSIRMSTVPTMSAVDILDGKTPPGALQGKDVLVGWTSPTMRDVHTILGQGQYPGVYFHVIGAESLRRGSPLNAGWLPPFLFGALAAAAYLLLGGKRAPLIYVAVFLVFGVLPLWLDAQLIEVEVVPGMVLFAIAAWRWRSMCRVEATRRVHPTTDLPNLVALEDGNIAEGGTLIAAKLRNFSEIAASFPTNVERDLFQELARRIRVSGDVGTVYHGEDALLWFSHQPMGQELANHLTGLHKLSSQSVRIGDREVDMLLSFGVDADSQRPLSSRVASAILSADEAARANDIWKFYDPQRLHQAAWQLSLMSRLTHAVQSGEIWVAYQPKVDMATRRIVGAEALARWTHPTAGPIGPDQFIAAAEAHNRIGELTAFVLDRALADLAALREAGHDIGMAVNLSSQMLTEPSLVGRIGTLLVRHGLPPSKLTLEITETGELLSSPAKVETMERIAATGVQISIDDYGTGNATLEYLSRLPSQEVKIDRTFITDLDRNAQNLILVRSTMEMAHRLGRRVVAEGVENEAVMRVLKELGCDIAQGYLLGKPLPLAELRRLLSSDQNRPKLKVVIS